MGKYRMEEPYGFIEGEKYYSIRNTVDDEIKYNRQIDKQQTDEAFTKVEYNKELESVIFKNTNGVAVGQLDMTEIIASELVKEAKYDPETQKLIIEFDNGDTVSIDMNSLITQQEAGNGLELDGNKFAVKIATDSEAFLQVDENGLKNVGIQDAIDVEKERAMAAEAQEVSDREADVDEEEARAISAETLLNQLINAETNNRIADVDEEEARAISAETVITNTIGTGFTTASTETVTQKYIDLSNSLTTEIGNRTTQDNQLQNNISQEAIARESADNILENHISNEAQARLAQDNVLSGAIDTEASTRETEDAELDTKITAEYNRATTAEGTLQTNIDNVSTSLEALDDAKANKAEAVSSAEYVQADKQILFKDISGNVLSVISTSEFVKDGMIDDVKVEDGKLKIIFNTDSGKEEIDIPLTDIFDPSNYYSRNEIDEKIDSVNTSIENEESARIASDAAISGAVDTKASQTDLNALEGTIEAEVTRATEQENKKVDKEINGTNGKALIFNESDGGGAKFEHSDGTWSFAGVNDGGENGIAGQIYALKKNDENKMDGSRIDVTKNAMYYTVGANSATDRMVEANEIAVKGDIPTNFYSQEEVNALIKAKETEIYNLTKLVGEIGGNVTYTYPNELGTSLTELMKNNGTVKLNEDATITRFGPGITAKNKVTINLNNHDLTSTNAGSYGAIMGRGSQEITIGGKGTIEAGDGICIEANGSNAVFNLTGSTTVYHTNRPGGELIYCYAGTINISNGTFKNDGASNYTLNCYDANYQDGTAKIIVTGGKFYDFNPADNSAEGEHTSFLAEGYHVETSTVVEEGVEHTVYTVKKDA